MYIKRDPLGEGNLSFRKKRKRFPFLLILLYLLILGGALYVFLHLQEFQPRVQAAFGPEPTPTLSAQEFRARGDMEYEQGHLLAATEFYRQAYDLEPQNLDLMFQLSRVLTMTAQLDPLHQDPQTRENVEEALAIAEEMILIEPEDPRGYAAKSHALDYLDRAQEAAVEALRAVEINPNYALGHAYLAEAYADLGQLRQARDHAQLSIQLEPYSVDARRNYAYVLEFYGDYGGAVQQYLQAIQLHSELLDLWYGLARNYRGMGEIENSVLTYQQIIRRTPDNPRPYVELGRTYFEVRDDDAAQGTLEQAVRLVCEDCPRYTYEELERIDFEYDRSRLPDEIYIPAWQRLGNVFTTRRNYEDAVAVFEELINWQEANGQEPSPATMMALASNYYYIDRTADGEPLCDRAIPLVERALDRYELERMNDPILLKNILSVFVLCRDEANTPPTQTVVFPEGYPEPDVEVQRPGTQDAESSDDE